MKDKHTQPWVPMYADKWLFGSTRLELDPGERSVFVDLIMMGSKDNGYIRANETIPYPPRQLAAFLNISEELLQSTVTKCIQYGKLDEIAPGMWRISSWDNFSLSKSYKSELQTGKKAVPGVQRTESSQQRTNSSPIVEENRIEESRVDENRKSVRVEDVKIPEHISKDAWQGFLDMRKSIKKPLTAHAAVLTLARLEKFRSEGHNPNDLLNLAVMNSWQGIYLPTNNGPKVPSKGCAPIPGKYDGIGEKV